MVKVSRESSNENPHFSLPETFHNALSFRNYDNHGFSSSITNLLDTFIVQSEHNNGHSHQRIPRGGGHSDLTAPSPPMSNQKYHLLRKNMPRDFPMIVRQAIEKQEEENVRKLSIKGKIPRQNAVLHMPNTQDDRSQSLPPPPPLPSNTELETPSIENAPSSIDFTLAVNSNISNILNNETDSENNKVTTPDINLNFKTVGGTGTLENGTPIGKKTGRNMHQRSSESSGISSIDDDLDDESTDGRDFDPEKDTESFFNNINAMQLDDYDDNDESEHCLSKDYTDLLDQSFNNMDFDDGSDMNSNLDSSNSTKCSDVDDDDKVFQEFNSHQYWYISPDIPVDMDILLEPEEKREFIVEFSQPKFNCMRN